MGPLATPGQESVKSNRAGFFTPKQSVEELMHASEAANEVRPGKRDLEFSPVSAAADVKAQPPSKKATNGGDNSYSNKAAAPVDRPGPARQSPERVWLPAHVWYKMPFEDRMRVIQERNRVKKQLVGERREQHHRAPIARGKTAWRCW